MKSIENRLRRIEKAKEREPPHDLFGKYYDTLTNADKLRFWRYVYGDDMTIARAEQIEVNHVSGTLHFVCNIKPGDIELPGLDDDWLASFDRLY